MFNNGGMVKIGEYWFLFGLFVSFSDNGLLNFGVGVLFYYLFSFN